MNWLYLLIAILAEVIATSTLKATESFTRLLPSMISITGYIVAFYFLSLTLRTIPIGIAYALWAGLGIMLVALVGWVVYKQALDIPAIIGMSFIVIGIIILNLFSKTIPH